MEPKYVEAIKAGIIGGVILAGTGAFIDVDITVEIHQSRRHPDRRERSQSRRRNGRDRVGLRLMSAVRPNFDRDWRDGRSYDKNPVAGPLGRGRHSRGRRCRCRPHLGRYRHRIQDPLGHHSARIMRPSHRSSPARPVPASVASSAACLPRSSSASCWRSSAAPCTTG